MHPARVETVEEDHMLSSACSHAFCDFLQTVEAKDFNNLSVSALRRIFAAGWKARKAAEYRAAVRA